jgi:hypothetical protein
MNHHHHHPHPHPPPPPYMFWASMAVFISPPLFPPKTLDWFTSRSAARQLREKRWPSLGGVGISSQKLVYTKRYMSWLVVWNIFYFSIYWE